MVIFNKPVGKIVENEVFERLQMVFPEYILEKRIVRSDNTTDTFHGVDFIINDETGIDVTVNSNKNFASKVKFIYDKGIKMYYRYSNGNMVFDKPVIVLKADLNEFASILDAARSLANNIVRICDNIEMVIKKLDKHSIKPEGLDDIIKRQEEEATANIVKKTENGKEWSFPAKIHNRCAM